MITTDKKPLSSAARFSSPQPRVSIVTPSYNQGQFIERTILSVLKQDYPNVQYIVMDACSKDNTHKILDQYRKEIAIVVEEKDKGQADAINKGFAKADGEILAYLNSDDCYAAPDVVSRAVDHLVNHPDIDLVYGKRYYINEYGLFHLSYPHRDFDEDLLNQACYIPQECCFWTKAIYDKAGSQVDAGYLFAMDYELWLRFLKHGAKFQSLDSVFGYFRWYEGQKSVDAWERDGLPEIARLQESYVGKSTPNKVMQVKFMEHYLGVDNTCDPDRFEIGHKMWSDEIKLKQQLLKYAPIDHWVFQRSEKRRSKSK